MLRVERCKYNGKAPWIVRLAARIVTKWMNKDNTGSYQVDGKINYFYDTKLDSELRNRYGETGIAKIEVDVQANKMDILYWLMRICGYNANEPEIIRWLNKK